ncbi:MAG: toll/interleukin-1 receptor domain-containing protein [Oscillibacter sp.]|nr:toll/interleukin-1 receptor domain-containing protein [Oscillibacter sp.]
MEQRDFFISYTKRDKPWAVWIADTLKANGYTSYCQALDIKPGDDFLEKMEEFLDNSANFIAVWSKGYSESRFCMREFRAAYNGLEKGWMGCLLPVRIDSHPLKRLYGSLVHADLSDMGAASAEELMDAVRDAVPHSVAPPDNAQTEREKLTPLPNNAPVKSETPLNNSQEDAETLYQRGNDYYFGRNGIQRDYVKAKEYYERAAAKGNAGALYGLGAIYSNGYIASIDYAKALDYYEQAAGKGHAGAMSNLAYHYENGLGVKRDYVKAREYYEKAAAQGYETALYMLGEYYQYGRGVLMDYAKALAYYQKVIDTDNFWKPYAQRKMEEIRQKRGG